METTAADPKTLNADRIFKFILKCCRHRNTPDLHSFEISIPNGSAYVEVQETGEVYIEHYRAGREAVRWTGSPVAAANRLAALGAIYESIQT